MAILLAPGWHFSKVFRYDCEVPAAGCIGAEITNGTHTVFVASIKLPPNLDATCNRWETSVLQRASRRLAARVMEWASPYRLAFICGDLNTTASCCLDRPGSCSPPCPVARPGNVISEVLTSPISPFCDTFRELHPNEHGFTRDRARLDYIILPRALLSSDLVDCAVHPGAFPSDHFPVSVSVDVRCPVDTRPLPRWSAPRAIVERASCQQRVAFACAADQAVGALVRAWGTGQCQAPALLDRQRALAECIVDCARAHLPYSDAPRAGQRRRPARHLRSAVSALQRAITCARALADRPYLIRCPRTQTAFARLKAHALDTGLALSDPTAWAAWADGAGLAALRSAERALRDHNSRDRLRGDRQLSEALWRRNRTKRDFFAKYFREEASADIISVVDPHTGRRTFEAETCKRVVAAAAAEPFSKAVDLGPSGTRINLAVCSGTCGCSCSDHCRKGADIAPPHSCADRRCCGPSPLWEFFYGSGARVCASQTGTEFEQVLRPPSPSEVARCIAGCPGGKSAGHDGLSIDLLRLATDCDLLADTDPAVGGDGERTVTRTAVALSLLTTWAFGLGIQTEHVTRGLIRFVPKGRLSGLPDVEEMRPITLLSEIGKVPSRILASRVSAVLDAKPELLHAAQRAFLSNGDVSQCIHTALDVFEDFRSLKRNRGGALHVMSYDVQKAYDSVQLDSIRATLHRYRFPSPAVEYICSGLVGARSAVITAHGLTDPFDVRTSVRQGDPLAPLLYILFLDVLHRGLDADPGGPVEGAGYTMSTGSHTRVASCGYADDLLAFAESAHAAERMHEWTRTFFGMHATRINAKKTKYFCSGVRRVEGALAVPDPAVVADLRSVCGHTRIAPRPTGASFRYLGVMLSPDLDWTDELARLNSIVWSARSSILNYRMRFLPAVDAVRSYVVPRMEGGLQAIGLSAKVMATLDRWTGLLQSAVLVAHSSLDPGVSRAAFCFVSGMPCLSLTAKSLRAVSIYQRLCLDSRSMPRTTADRVAAASATGSLSDALSTRHPPKDARTGGHLRLNRSAAALWGEYRLPLSLAWNTHYVEPSVAIPCDAQPVANSALEEVRIDWDPRQPPDKLFSTPATRSYDIFTDGSTPRDGGAVSGYAAVIYDSSDLGLDPVVLGSYLKCSGNNFLAEMCALVAALMAVPAQATVRIFSDSLACIQAVCRD